MSIRQVYIKIKVLGHKVPAMADRRDVFGSAVIILVALASFYVGKIEAIQNVRAPVTIQAVPLRDMPEPVKTAEKGKGEGHFVASKSGSKYHRADCPGARSIAEANKVWFSTKEEAEKAGYTPAANCPGI